jgi:hypothetical protein
MFRGVLLVAAAAGIASSAHAQDVSDDPEALVRELMRLEIWSLSATDAGEEVPFSPSSLARFFTPEFAAAYEAVMQKQERIQEPLIDGDLILNSQEYCPIVDVSVGRLGAAPNDALVQVHFRSQWCWSDVPREVSERVSLVEFMLVRGEDGWRINDFGSGGSARRLFANLLRD